MIELKNWDNNEQSLITKDRPRKWFDDDYVLFALYDKDFSEEEIGSMKITSCNPKEVIWKPMVIDGTKISFAFKKPYVLNINENKDAFENFLLHNIENPDFSGKFVIFVKGRFYDVGENETVLVKKIHRELGNIDMYVGKIALESNVHLIDTPELR